MSPKFTPQAVQDIEEIAAYLATFNYAAAAHVAAQIFSVCDEAAQAPYLGHRRADLSRDSLRVRAIAPGSPYLVIYDAESKPVRILRVLHGARDVGRML